MRARVVDALERAFAEDRPPQEVATSFSVGLFLAGLPNFGLALVAFAAMASLADRVSKLALIAAVVVMNPVVKWAIYVGGFWLGARLLGPVPAGSGPLLSLSAGRPVLLRLLVGNVVIAGACSAIGYVAALRFVRELERREIDLGEVVPVGQLDGSD